MHISFQKKLTTVSSLAAGAACGYLAPAHWLKGFAVGFILGKINAADTPPTTEREYKARYRYLVKKSLPGVITAGLNIYSYYVLVSKIALPIFFGMNMLPTVLFIGGLCLGRHAGHYFTLSRLPTIGLKDAEFKNELHRLREELGDQHRKNQLQKLQEEIRDYNQKVASPRRPLHDLPEAPPPPYTA